MKSRTAVTVLVFLTSGCATSRLGHSDSRELVGSEILISTENQEVKYVGQGDPTSSEAVLEAVERYLTGDTLGPDYALGEFGGRVTMRCTGRRSEDGRPEVLVEVVDDSADLDTARFTLGDAIDLTATRAGGGIRDEDGRAWATFLAYLPAQLPRDLVARIEWGAAGAEPRAFQQTGW